jgi:dienelactone hydrolase
MVVAGPSRQVNRKEAAEDGWKRCLAFLDKHLKA